MYPFNRKKAFRLSKPVVVEHIDIESVESEKSPPAPSYDLSDQDREIFSIICETSREFGFQKPVKEFWQNVPMEWIVVAMAKKIHAARQIEVYQPNFPDVLTDRKFNDLA